MTGPSTTASTMATAAMSSSSASARCRDSGSFLTIAGVIVIAPPTKDCRRRPGEAGRTGAARPAPAAPRTAGLAPGVVLAAWAAVLAEGPAQRGERLGPMCLPQVALSRVQPAMQLAQVVPPKARPEARPAAQLVQPAALLAEPPARRSARQPVP